MAEFTNLLNSPELEHLKHHNPAKKHSVKFAQPKRDSMPVPSVALKRNSIGAINVVRFRSQQVDNQAILEALERKESQQKNNESTLKPLVKLRSQRMDLS